MTAIAHPLGHPVGTQRLHVGARGALVLRLVATLVVAAALLLLLARGAAPDIGPGTPPGDPGTPSTPSATQYLAEPRAPAD